MPPPSKPTDRSVSPPDAPRTATGDGTSALPDVSRCERTAGWGDEAGDERDDEWYHRERPPHYD
jgi:hypothetical protein